jgi:hypothetical protein
LAYALSRTFTILTEILPGTGADVRRLTSKLGIDISKLKIDDLTLNDFVSVVFGLYTYGNKIADPNHSVFDVRTIFSKVGFPARILESFVKARALDISEFGKHLTGDTPPTRDNFLEELRHRAFLTDSLNCFRRFPLLKIDANRVLILDLQFLVELLTSGVYWSIFDGLPTDRRETFRELWGGLFELYTVGLLKDFYPPVSGILATDLKDESCQIDALLDFGREVLVLEVKSSLLTELAKRGVDESTFVKDFDRKFVQNEKGASKALLQLATSCKAVEDGKIRTATPPARIYPILVSDEPAVETFFFNAYANEIFEKNLPRGSRIQPITVMSINELEEILPYVSGNAFSWAELLGSRFKETGVGPFSVHQAIYDLSRSKGFQQHRNQAIRNKFEKVWKIIISMFTPPAAE